jgi:hypothetical protein
LQKRAFLSVSVFTEDDIADEHGVGIEDGKTLAGQDGGLAAPSDGQAFLSAGEMVPVENADAKTGQQRSARAAEMREELMATRKDVGDELRGDGQFEMLELLVNGLEGDGDAVEELLVGGLDVGSGAADDEADEVDGGGEQKGAGVAEAGVPVKEGVEVGVGKGVLDGGSGHDGERTASDELLEDGTENHGGLGGKQRYNLASRPILRRFYTTVNGMGGGLVNCRSGRSRHRGAGRWRGCC